MSAMEYGYGYQDPYTTNKIENYIECKSNTAMSHFNSSFINIDGDIMYSIYNVVSDYIDEIKNNYCMEIILDKDQMMKYKYRPKLLCYDVYGSTEIAFIILLINDMYSAKQFTKDTLYLPTQTNMKELCSNIFNANKDAIKYYNKEN